MYLGVVAVIHKAALALPEHVVIPSVLGEAPVPAHHNLLAAGELELGTTHGLLSLPGCARGSNVTTAHRMCGSQVTR